MTILSPEAPARGSVMLLRHISWPTDYYRVSTPRAGARFSVGACGLYFDYIFVDANEQVVFAA